MRPSYCAECNGSLDPYLPDCPHCGAQVDHDGHGHHDSDIVVHRGRDKKIEVGRKWKFHVPWGLFLVLGLYAAGAYSYVQYTNSTSPQTLAAKHLAVAEDILGKDNGESAKSDQLQVAYQELIDALTITPEDAWGHQQLEVVTWELNRRGQKPPAELKRRGDFLAASWQNMQAAKTSQLPESPRERFGLDELEDSASRAKRYIALGSLIIILLWAYKEFQDYKFMHRREDEHEVLHREELLDLGSHRRR